MMQVLVTGATGTVGARAAQALAERGARVRALVRDEEKAGAMLGPEIELARGDLGDRRSLERALAGVDRVFLACGNVPGQVELECAAVDAAKAAGVSRLVKLSGPRAAPDSPLLFERWHGEIERHLLASGVPWVLLRPAPFMTNLLASAEAVRATGTLFAPAGTARIAYVDPGDVAEAAAGALLGDGHDGATHALTGPEAITFEQIARELSAATGREIAYVDVPDEVARQGMVEGGMPPVVADFLVGFFATLRAGSMERTTDAVRVLTGREPRPFSTFARERAVLFGTLEAEPARAG